MPGQRARGQALVEFALIMPLLLVVVFALIDFSRLLFTWISITNGSRELARVVSITGPWVFNANLDTATTVNAFINLTILAGPATAVQNFSLSPGTGTISCSNISSSGCGFKLNVDYSASSITFSPGGGATGSASYALPGTALPSLPVYGVTADGDFAAVTLVTEGNGISSQMSGFLQVCPLPMTTACALSQLEMGKGGGGIIEVDTSYTFHFNPLFQNRVTSFINAGFISQLALLTTTTRTTGE
jgi:Flp pilus assembly protein TadG